MHAMILGSSLFTPTSTNPGLFPQVVQDLSPSETQAGGGPAASHAIHRGSLVPRPSGSEPPAELPEHCERALEGPAGLE